MPISLNIESNEYRWIENWITIPESSLGKTNGRTHGVAVVKNGEVVIFHQADPAVLFYSPGGVLLNNLGNSFEVWIQPDPASNQGQAFQAIFKSLGKGVYTVNARGGSDS